MAGAQIQINDAQMDAVVSLLKNIRNGAETAVRISLNAGLDKAVSLSAKGINAKVTLTQTKIKEFFSTARASNSNLSALLRLTGRPVPLVNFKTGLQTRTGVAVQVWRDQPADKFRHAFFATMPSGHVGLFLRREFAAGSYAGRLPIDEMVGPPVTSVYEETPGLAAQVESGSADRVQEELARQTDRLLGI